MAMGDLITIIFTESEIWSTAGFSSPASIIPGVSNGPETTLARARLALRGSKALQRLASLVALTLPTSRFRDEAEAVAFVEDLLDAILTFKADAAARTARPASQTAAPRTDAAATDLASALAAVANTDREKPARGLEGAAFSNAVFADTAAALNAQSPALNDMARNMVATGLTPAQAISSAPKTLHADLRRVAVSTCNTHSPGEIESNRKSLPPAAHALRERTHSHLASVIRNIISSLDPSGRARISAADERKLSSELQVGVATLKEWEAAYHRSALALSPSTMGSLASLQETWAVLSISLEALLAIASPSPANPAALAALTMQVNRTERQSDLTPEQLRTHLSTTLDLLGESFICFRHGGDAPSLLDVASATAAARAYEATLNMLRKDLPGSAKAPAAAAPAAKPKDKRKRDKRERRSATGTTTASPAASAGAPAAGSPGPLAAPAGAVGAEKAGLRPGWSTRVQDCAGTNGRAIVQAVWHSVKEAAGFGENICNKWLVNGCAGGCGREHQMPADGRFAAIVATAKATATAGALAPPALAHPAPPAPTATTSPDPRDGRAVTPSTALASHRSTPTLDKPARPAQRTRTRPSHASHPRPPAEHAAAEPVPPHPPMYAASRPARWPAGTVLAARTLTVPTASTVQLARAYVAPLYCTSDPAPCKASAPPIATVASVHPSSPARPPLPPPEPKTLEPNERRYIVHLFAGLSRPGDLEGAIRHHPSLPPNLHCVSIDTLRGGRHHDMLHGETFPSLMRLAHAGAIEVAVIGIPCSSFSPLWASGRGQPPLRHRLAPEGIQPMPPQWRIYLERANELIRRSAEFALAVWRTGGTYVIENPGDTGTVGSPHFAFDSVHLASLWTMPAIRVLATATTPVVATGVQCQLFSLFRKLTTLMAAGPRAHTIASFDRVVCTHASHARHASGSAGGRDRFGRTLAQQSGAYPPELCAWLADVSVNPCPAPALAFTSDSAPRTQLRASIDRATTANSLATTRFQLDLPVQSDASALGAELAQHLWESAPDAVPAAWPEASALTADALSPQLATPLRYISHRRAEPERPAALANRELPIISIPSTLPRPPTIPTWPPGAPPPPVTAWQLWNPGVYDEILVDIALRARDVQRMLNGELIAARATAVYPASLRPPWARSVVWDHADPLDARPVQPFAPGELAAHQDVRPAFFREWGARLQWSDLDMLEQIASTGLKSHTACGLATVISSHHGGLRQNIRPAQASIQADIQRGWMSAGSSHPRFTPQRLVAKNCVERRQWRIDDTDTLYTKVKWRVTTDDSQSTPDAPSRNEGIDLSQEPACVLPTPRTLPEAVAILKATLRQMGLVASESELDRIILWALDLSDAYRACCTAREEWYLQGFIWASGALTDYRCGFGGAHMVQLFERATLFIIAIVRHRIAAYDDAHRYHAPRRAWSAWRASRGLSACCSFATIFIDDALGATVHAADEPTHGPPPGRAPITSSIEVSPRGRVRLRLYACLSRAEVHLAIASRTANAAGWRTAFDKRQIGTTIEELGLGVTTEGAGAIFVTEPRRRGLLVEIHEHSDPSLDRIRAPRPDLERLVGRLGHIAMITPSAGPWLQPLYRMRESKAYIRDTPTTSAARGTRAFKRARVDVKGSHPTQREFQLSLRFWKHQLEVGIAVPLAPRSHFPGPSQPGVAFQFSDAAREAGTGYGAWTLLRVDGRLMFLHMRDTWSQRIGDALRANELSMPAGEAFGAVAFAFALSQALPGLTHLLCFTDSDATRSAIATSGSASPQLNSLVRWLDMVCPQLQLLAIWQPGSQNTQADQLSRTATDHAAAIHRARALGALLIELHTPPLALAALEIALNLPQTSPS